MKDTKFKATTHSCSKCNYRSLNKANVQTHLKTKCDGATLVTEEKIVSHFSEHDVEKFKATLYQCSKCDYTTPQPTNMKSHISKVCPGAKILNDKRVLCFEDVPKEPVFGNISADNQSALYLNSNSNVSNSYNTILNLMLPPQGSDELLATVSGLARLIDTGKLRVVIQGEIEELPAKLSIMLKKLDSRLDNKTIKGNDVVSKIDDSVVDPVVRHSKKEMARLVDALFSALQTPLDIEVFNMGIICDEDTVYHEDHFDRESEDRPAFWNLELDDVMKFRNELMPLFFDQDESDKLFDLMKDMDVDRIAETVKDISDKKIVEYSDFFKGVKSLIEDPTNFRYVVDIEMQKQIRIAAKKYALTLKREKAKKNNTI